MKNSPASAVIGIFSLLTLSIPAFAGTSAKTYKSTAAEGEPNPLTLMNIESSYVFQSNLHRGGHQDAWHNEIEIGRRIPLHGLNAWWQPSLATGEVGGWFLRLGADYGRFDFDTEQETRLPNTLQNIAGVIALEYIVDDQAGILIESRPGFYFSHDIRGNAFDAPTKLGVAIPLANLSSSLSSDWYLILGAEFSLLQSYHVIPVVGLLWKPRDSKWELDAYLPRPRLIYQATDKLQVWVGGEFLGGGYRTDDRDVVPKKFSGAAVTYSDYRGGAGLTYSFAKYSAIEIAGGYSFRREFDYDNAGERFRTDGAPYVRAQLKLDF